MLRVGCQKYKPIPIIPMKKGSFYYDSTKPKKN